MYSRQIEPIRNEKHRQSMFFALRNLLLICGLLVSVHAHSQPGDKTPADPVDAAVNAVLSRTSHPYLKKQDYRKQHKAVKDLYFFSHGALLWINHGDFQGYVAEVLQLLEAAQHRGLLPDDYDVERLKIKWYELKNQEVQQAQDLALFDTALSIAALRYLSDLQSGRISAQSVGFNFPQTTDYDSLVRLILDAVQEREIRQLAERVEPDYPAYRQLKKALQHYRRLAQNYRFPTLLFKRSLREGDNNPQLPILKRKLFVLGLLDDNDFDTDDSVYQGVLVEAVQRFQRRHGLKDDGVIGKKTLRALNVPLPQRVRQIELALERLRWLPRLKQDQPLIFVNIPAFQLWAYRFAILHGDGDLSMKVVVGIARQNKTPVFMGTMSYLEFSPYWNVPKKITFDEILPKLQENPDYLNQQNMELVINFSQNAEPQSLSQESLEMLQKGQIKIRQRPGPKNSLGLVKFIFPNRYSVYMHDTPARKLFRSERRDFSHGCIRVEHPQALAEFVLRNRKGWQTEQIQEAMQKGKTQTVSVIGDIPVVIFYTTAMAIGEKVYFFEDIYGYDEVLNQALFRESQNVSMAAI